MAVHPTIERLSEEVMVVETALLQPFFTARLIRSNTEAILDLIASRHLFIARDVAEVSPQYRQIIPYVVIRHGVDTFVLRRTARQTEARLHHKLSLGIGGHINPGHSLMDGLQKELGEEVSIDTDYDLRFAAILNDESTEVSRVHLGAVYLLEVREKKVAVRETEKMSGQWMTPAAIRRSRGALESWSQIIDDELIA